MPGQFHRRRYLYIEFHRDAFGHTGKEYLGFVCGRWPILTLFRDEAYYEDVGTYGIVITPWFEVGLFVDWRTKEEAMKNRGDRESYSAEPR